MNQRHSGRHVGWLTVAPLLIFGILTLAGCSLIEGQEEARPAGAERAVPASSEETSRGTLIVTAVTVPPSQSGNFLFTGVPTGTIATDGTLVVTDLAPGTYTASSPVGHEGLTPR